MGRHQIDIVAHCLYIDIDTWYRACVYSQIYEEDEELVNEWDDVWLVYMYALELSFKKTKEITTLLLL